MNNEIRQILEDSLTDEMSSFKVASDPKDKLTDLKLAAVMLKMLKEDEESKTEEQNRSARLLLDQKKLSLDRSRLNFEKEKHANEHALETAKLALQSQQIKLDKERFEFEKQKQKETVNQSRFETISKIGIALLGLVPAVLSFIGGVMALKLEYNDMGRTPSLFKDFMHNVKN